MISVVMYAIVALALFIIYRIYLYLRYIEQTGNLPGLRCLVAPLTLLGVVLPTSWFNPGLEWHWRWRKHAYQRTGTDTISVVPFLHGGPVIYTTSLEVAKQVVNTKGPFEKADELSRSFSIWGPNIFAANGDNWRRHRRIITPAFSHATYSYVWSQTLHIFDEMASAEGWSNKSITDVPAINAFTSKLALIVISICGFGKHLSWDYDTAPQQKNMSFGNTIQTIATTHIARLILPQWVYSFPVEILQRMETAFSTMTVWMRDWLKERKDEIASGAERQDVLSLMVKSAQEDGKWTLSDPELIGNTFVLITAGHDTTAHTLDATVGFLALDPELQEEVFQELMEVMPTEADMTYENSARLVKLSSCFVESSRLFPSVYLLPREAAEDTVLRNVGPNGDEEIVVEKGTRVVVDLIGLHHNPRHFPDPEAYKPSRWYDARDTDMTSFSMGSRVCIGRRFAITEATAFLAKLLRNFRLEVVLQEGETREQWRARVLKGQTQFTFGVGNVPVRLVRRK